MKEKGAKLVMIALAIILVVVGCSPKETFPIGIFTNGDWELEFKTDGSCISKFLGAVAETATCTVTDDQIVFKGDFCGEDKLGEYTWTFDDNILSFKAIDDKCSDRLGVLKDSQWLKKP
jgi:hypothetical protein